LDEDLLLACQQALRIPRTEARQRALQFTWAAAAEQFLSHLVRADGFVTEGGRVKKSVTSLSSE
jgi:hypothetical protein